MVHADLNQIRTFVTLYETRSVTAAAELLHVTQPTVSYTLGRLRRRFGDDLFRRQGTHFAPTPLATRLFRPLRDALAQIDATLAGPEEFDPARLTDQLVLSLSSLGEQTFLPRILAEARVEAPGVRLGVHPHVASEAEDALARGIVDLAISVTVLSPERLWRTPFLGVEYVAVTSASHPLPPTDADMFAGRRFVQVGAQGGHTYPNQALTEHGLIGHVTLAVESYATVPAALEGSDLVALLPRHVCEVFAARYALSLHPLPWPVQSPPVSVYTRPERSLSPAQAWFRGLVLRALSAG